MCCSCGFKATGKNCFLLIASVMDCFIAVVVFVGTMTLFYHLKDLLDYLQYHKFPIEPAIWGFMALTLLTITEAAGTLFFCFPAGKSRIKCRTIKLVIFLLVAFCGFWLPHLLFASFLETLKCILAYGFFETISFYLFQSDGIFLGILVAYEIFIEAILLVLYLGKRNRSSPLGKDTEKAGDKNMEASTDMEHGKPNFCDSFYVTSGDKCENSSSLPAAFAFPNNVTSFKCPENSEIPKNLPKMNEEISITQKTSQSKSPSNSRRCSYPVANPTVGPLKPARSFRNAAEETVVRGTARSLENSMRRSDPLNTFRMRAFQNWEWDISSDDEMTMPLNHMIARDKSHNHMNTNSLKRATVGAANNETTTDAIPMYRYHDAPTILLNKDSSSMPNRFREKFMKPQAHEKFVQDGKKLQQDQLLRNTLSSFQEQEAQSNKLFSTAEIEVDREMMKGPQLKGELKPQPLTTRGNFLCETVLFKNKIVDTLVDVAFN